MSQPAGTAAFAARLRRRLRAGVTTANAAGAVVVFLLSAVLSPTGSVAFETRGAEMVAVFVVVTGALLLLGMADGTRRTRRTTAWLVEGRDPTAAERDATLGLPWRLTVNAGLLWLVAAAVFGPYVPARLPEASSGDGVRVAVAIVMGGLVSSTLTYLLSEREMRPVFAVALAGRSPSGVGLGVRGRLVVFWVMGSGVPLLAIGLSLVGVDPGGDDLAGAVAFLVAAGTVSGLVTMVYAARLVADPVQAVRLAMARVREGAVDVAVPVDDATELGQLEAGFNEMVVGLAERRRLQDLFGRHVGLEVARQALERGAALGGEQREVSVLFVDLVGSTALAASRPAAEVVERLNEFFGAVVQAVAAEGGWVDKFQGDGALCVFGAPGDQPDHAARALRAARALQGCLAGMAAGIGVSSGVAVAGNVGTEQRFEYTVIGDPVNEAYRLTEAAKDDPARVLASRATVERAGDEARRWAARAELALRGRPAPTAAYAPA